MRYRDVGVLVYDRRSSQRESCMVIQRLSQEDLSRLSSLPFEPEQARQVMEVTLAADLSAERHQPVTLPLQP